MDHDGTKQGYANAECNYHKVCGKVGQLVMVYNHKPTNYIHKYAFEKTKPLYPFGYGLDVVAPRATNLRGVQIAWLLPKQRFLELHFQPILKFFIPCVVGCTFYLPVQALTCLKIMKTSPLYWINPKMLCF